LKYISNFSTHGTFMCKVFRCSGVHVSRRRGNGRGLCGRTDRPVPILLPLLPIILVLVPVSVTCGRRGEVEHRHPHRHGHVVVFDGGGDFHAVSKVGAVREKVTDRAPWSRCHAWRGNIGKAKKRCRDENRGDGTKPVEGTERDGGIPHHKP
jgi:hypothetical protein